MEEMGGVSSCSLSFKETCTEQVAVNRAAFDKVKRVLLYMTIEEFQIWHFMKTLNNHTNLGIFKKMTPLKKNAEYIMPDLSLPLKPVHTICLHLKM